MKRSSQLVKGGWWRVFGVTILISVLGTLLAGVLGVPFLAAGALVESGLLTLLGQIFLDGVIYSFTALAGTLLFFDLKARKPGAPLPSSHDRYPQLPPRDWDAPERPY